MRFLKIQKEVKSIEESEDYLHNVFYFYLWVIYL